MPIQKRPIDTGSLIDRVALQEVTITKDSYGAPVRTWTTVFTARASITHDGTSEYFTGSREEATDSVTCVLRVNPNYKVLSAWRVLHYGSDENDVLATYAIKSVRVDPGKRVMVLSLESGQADG